MNREEAIAFGKDQLEIFGESRMSEFIRLAIQALEERPKGEWIEHSTYKGVLICSHCNHGEAQAYDTFKFCPYCGADMRGDV